MGLTQITIGFVPLLDSAVLIAAQEMGFADSEGLALTLVRESSWANIRDRVAIGHFEKIRVTQTDLLLPRSPLAFRGFDRHA